MASHYPHSPQPEQQPSGKHRIPDMPRRYIRSLDADQIARLLDGADHAEPEVVRLQRSFSQPSPREAIYAVAGGIAIVVFILLSIWVLA
jgi:hypothetical protein